MSEPLLLDVGGAAELLTMSERKVERLIATGELVSVRCGGLRRIRRTDIEAYVAGLGKENDAASPLQLTALAGNHIRNGRRRR